MKNDRGDPLGIVHRDVSPQNILVGADGITRVVDFGVAKAASRAQTTREGQVKGKIAYMSPEQLQSRPLDHRSDVFATSVVLWELLTDKRLFAADDPAASITKILLSAPEPPSRYVAELDPRVDAVLARGLARTSAERFASTRDMARALEAALPRAGTLEVEDWMATVASDPLRASAERVAQIEEASVRLGVVPAAPNVRPPPLPPHDARAPAAQPAFAPEPLSGLTDLTGWLVPAADGLQVRVQGRF